jgi:hypothetical protein
MSRAQGRRGTAATVGLLVAGVFATCGLLLAGGFAVLYAFNPVGDEWVCSEGEAPAGPNGRYNSCYDTGTTLPEGAEWDPFGNRPMPYNCDKDGWVLVEREVEVRGSTERRADPEQDCVREGTDLPGRWRPAADS